VRAALAEVLVSGFEVGAALAVYVDGDAVVDLWGGYADAARTRPWQRDTIGHGNARAVARLYSALAGNGEVDGVDVLSPEIIARAIAEQVYGDDTVLQRPTRFGLGFQLTMAERRLGPSPRAFGHFGAGGSLGFADPDSRLAFGYAMNQGRGGWQHAHVRHMIDLVYAELGRR